jgi:ATP-dependent protease ClpP protease subunit
MKNEILLYFPIANWNIESIVREVNAIDDDAELTLRINTPGGSVMDGYSLLSRLSDRKGSTVIFVDGVAYSMGAYITLYGHSPVASEMARFMFHKAAYPSYYEPDDQEKSEVIRINGLLKAKMKEVLKDIPETKALISKVFEEGVRNDVYLTAKEAKKIGLIKEIRPLDLKVKAMIEEQAQLSARYGEGFENVDLNNNSSNNLKNEKMTIEQLKAEHPAIYAAIVAEGERIGAANEKDRVGSFLAFVEVDAKAVKAGIDSGLKMSETQRSEFAMAAYKVQMNQEEVTVIPPVVTPPAPLVEETAEAKAEKEILAALGKTELTLKK